MKVIKISKQNVDNRLSEMQTAILGYMSEFPAPSDCKIGHLPATGDVVDGLGLDRNKSSFASVSRSLSRLVSSGKLSCWEGHFRSRGNGFRWSMPVETKVER